MRAERLGLSLVFTGLAALASCTGENQAAPAPVQKGGDDRSGEYTGTPDFWKPAPDHDEEWSWAQIAGVAADHPDRIIVGVRGDRNAAGQVRPNSSNYIVVVDGNGDIIERWTQWDTMLAFPHHVYISPYDPERHVWVVERGNTDKGIHEQILKFSNDGSELVMRLLDPNPVQSREVVRANRNPGPLDFGQPSDMAFLPDGSFLVSGRVHEQPHHQVQCGWRADDGVGGARERAWSVRPHPRRGRRPETVVFTWPTAATVAFRYSLKTESTSKNGPTCSFPSISILTKTTRSGSSPRS